MTPTVSIILPTYNRARFLPQALASIRDQRFSDWELIVVDDGSTDDTRDVVPRLTADFAQPVRYIYQENQGAYGARNTGLDNAQGKYIAFFDSDDVWLPHHLADCVQALEAHPDVDWVYSATRMVELTTGKVLSASCFLDHTGREREFLSLNTQTCGKFARIDDCRAVEVALRDALYAGLQTSVIRAEVFEVLRIPAFRVGEDQALTIHAMKRGFRMAWTRDVHVVYQVHADSISAGETKGNVASLRAMREFVHAFESLFCAVDLTRHEARVLRSRLAREYSWNIGYRLQREGEFTASRDMLRKGLSNRPLDLRIWKTYFASFAKECWWRLFRPRAVKSELKGVQTR